MPQNFVTEGKVLLKHKKCEAKSLLTSMVGKIFKYRIRSTMVAVVVSYLTNSAFALPPVVLTTDKHTALELVKFKGVPINIFDCQLRVEGVQPNFELVHSNGRLQIPTLAVKKIQDDAFVDVKVNGLLNGARVTRLWLPYSPTRNGVFRGRWQGAAYGDKPENWGNSFSILVNSPKTAVMSSAKKRDSTLLVRDLGSKSPYDKRKIISILNGVDLAHDTTGYGIELWSDIARKATTVDYQCSLR